MNAENKQQEKQSSMVGYQSAIGIAVVAMVFSIFIAVLLIVAVYHQNTTDTARADQLEKMIEQAKADPTDEVLAQEIQQLDTRFRRDQFARLYFLRRGTILLVVTLVILIVAVIRIASYRPKMPQPGPEGDIKARQVQQAFRIRLGLSGGMVLLFAGGLYLALHIPKQSPETTETAAQAAPLYTSMDAARSQWSVFRGPGGLGIATCKSVPDVWNGQTGENILWKSPILLPGKNSPVCWDDRIFVTGATEEKQQIFCFDTDSGKLLWTGNVSIPASPDRSDMEVMEDTGYAANTAVTDGQRVCAIFAGGDMGCFTVEGQLLWEKHFGIPESMYGYASSLTWFENLVIVQWDVGYEGENSKLIALDWQTGEIVWQTPRPVPNSWSSPTVVEIDSTYCILTNASPYTIVYDAKTGVELFRVDCVYGDIAATPILADDKIFAIEPYNKLVAIRTEKTLPEGETRIVWENSSDMPDICSPVSNGQYIWTLTTSGGLSCFNITDGKRIYRESMKLNFLASPTLVDQTLYQLSQKGIMVQLAAGSEFKEIRRCELGENCFASPAFQDGRIYIRGENNLYAIGND